MGEFNEKELLSQIESLRKAVKIQQDLAEHYKEIAKINIDEYFKVKNKLMKYEQNE